MKKVALIITALLLLVGMATSCGKSKEAQETARIDSLLDEYELKINEYITLSETPKSKMSNSDKAELAGLEEEISSIDLALPSDLTEAQDIRKDKLDAKYSAICDMNNLPEAEKATSTDDSSADDVISNEDLDDLEKAAKASKEILDAEAEALGALGKLADGLDK